ncbi:hypothetical protein GK047_13745 [Paenibacillus sp. SYP-B3998]|uniref:Uncharacterized protein n=1 Tax=Paenibacillus sp. SYP-B3998 TaxID=2678564 RepID=A0A6G3ZYA1_9BACL|nr:hypothetical protein [Paenibacillus sp. SYP-B3998]NEW07070.1 hypothetical protein [Paenibacillus sp. SYP-B3998]
MSETGSGNGARSEAVGGVQPKLRGRTTKAASKGALESNVVNEASLNEVKAGEIVNEQPPSGRKQLKRKQVAPKQEQALLPGTERMSGAWQRFYTAVSESIKDE